MSVVFNKFSLTSFTPPAPGIVTQNLILNLDAGNSSSYPGSGTTWTDLSGNGYNGTLTNGPTYSSSNGGSIVFDGVNDYVAVPSASPSLLNSLTNCTVSVWVKNSQWKESDIIEGGGAGSFAFWTATSLGKILWGKQYSDLSDFVSSSTNFSTVLNVWFNLVGVRGATDGNTSKLYYNGVLDGQNNISGTFTNPALTVGAGITGATSDGYFNGNIGVVHIYDRALSASEIQQNFNALKGRYGL